MENIDNTMEPQAPQQRHGFVTFWLWFMVIANLITAIMSLIMYEYGWYMIVSGILGFVNVAAAILLLNRKQLGFWLFVAVALLNICLPLIIGNISAMTLIGAILGPIILCLILQLKKDGKSYWSQLQ